MLITVDICGDVLYIAEGSVNLGVVDLHKCDEAKLPEGTIEDGDIKNHAAFVMTLTKLLNAHSYKATSAVMTFNSGAVLSRRLSLPPGKPAEISAMVKNQMSQVVSDPGDYVFEYSYASVAQTKDKPSDIWVYALEKDFIEKYFNVFKSTKLHPAALDIHPNCVEKLLFGATVNGVPISGQSSLFVDIERDYVEIHLFSNNERGFSRVAPISASEFLLIADNLGYGRQEKTMSLLERRLLAMSPDGGKKKNVESMSYEAIDISPEMLEKDSILADAARQYTGRLEDELSKMVQFQMMRDSSMPVTNVYLYGSLSSIRGLGANLSQSLMCPVELIESISKVKTDTNVRLERYINAIGALIRLK